MAERCVQTMKATLWKTLEGGEDMNLALLTYKTTPLNHRLPISSRVTELLEVQNLAAYNDSTNKTSGKLQTDHGQGQTKASIAVQQKHQSASKTQTVSKSDGPAGPRQKHMDPS